MQQSEQKAVATQRPENWETVKVLYTFWYDGPIAQLELGYARWSTNEKELCVQAVFWDADPDETGERPVMNYLIWPVGEFLTEVVFNLFGALREHQTPLHSILEPAALAPLAEEAAQLLVKKVDEALATHGARPAARALAFAAQVLRGKVPLTGWTD